jgi:AmmeMemoRadiSam system protein B
VTPDGAPVRAAAVAGSWYPGTAGAVRAEVARYLEPVPPPSSRGRLVALIAPHAGLRYSGPVAAHAYARLRRDGPLVAVLVGPSHRMAFAGVAAFARGAFETPLGRVPIADEVAERILAAGTGVFADERPHRQEHSLEMQLPFLQSVAPQARIVPLLMGSQSRSEVDALAPALAAAAGGDDVVLIASSDLSHYHPAPAAHRLDALVIREVEAFRPEGLMDLLERSHEHACGGGPMVAVMKAARAAGAASAEVLHYADSGDAGERDKSRVVGYLAAALAAAP